MVRLEERTGILGLLLIQAPKLDGTKLTFVPHKYNLTIRTKGAFCV